MRKLLVTLSMGMAVILISASCNTRSPEKKIQFFNTKVTKKLELDEQQKIKLTTLTDKMLVVFKEKNTNKDTLKSDIKKLLLQDSIKEAEVLKILEAKRDQFDLVLPRILPEIIDFHASLSGKQKEKLVKFLERFKHKRHGNKRL